MKEAYLYWQGLKEDFLDHVMRTQHVSSPKDYSRTMDLLFDFAATNGYAEYTPEVGYAFWEHYKTLGKSNSTMSKRRKPIRCLNEFLYGQSHWQKTPRALRKYKSSHVSTECPAQFAEEFEQFLESLKRDELKDVTIELYRTYCINHILCDFAQQGINSWSEIDARALTAAFSRAPSKGKFATYARRLFGYLVNVGVVECNYTGILPIIAKRKAIPSVYSEAEIKQLLDSIETVTPQGKRDHTMVLIAARLGLRVSDIANLRFENVDFDHGIVKFVQYKTSVPHQLPLPADVADALLDYIAHGREESEEVYIFLDGHGHPLANFSVGKIGGRHIKNAGIEIGTRSPGMHALRMSFASQLIADKLPYDVVRYALGHVHPNATRHYVQFSIEGLRACALDVPPPSGLLRKYLEGGM
jgi:integrase